MSSIIKCAKCGAPYDRHAAHNCFGVDINAINVAAAAATPSALVTLSTFVAHVGLPVGETTPVCTCALGAPYRCTVHGTLGAGAISGDEADKLRARVAELEEELAGLEEELDDYRASNPERRPRDHRNPHGTKGGK